MEKIQGGVCASQGFSANGMHCGLYRSPQRKDLALIVSNRPAAAAAVYTRNLVKGAPLLVTQAHLADGTARALVCNSANANTCNADGEQVASAMCDAVATALAIDACDVAVASTGVIGKPLPLAPICSAVPLLAKGLSASAEGASAAAEAILTTDTADKQVAFSFAIDGVECHIGGMAKGSGMIHPNMATMLVFITTDCAIAAPALQQVLSDDVQDSFNMISVDGDTSTNDMVVVLANGAAGNAAIMQGSAEYEVFAAALAAVTRTLCSAIAADGEGATKALTCTVAGAETKEIARTVAKSVICSSLVKTAMFGADANWGRVLCAVGYSGAEVDVSNIACSFSSSAGSVEVCRGGAGIPFSEETAKEVLSQNEIHILVSLGTGSVEATAWGCDLSYDYVRINGDYRT